jgi:hypothetical protein
MNEAAGTLTAFSTRPTRRGDLLERYRRDSIQFPSTNHVADERHRSVMLSSLQHV